MKLQVGKTYLRTKPIYSYTGGWNYAYCSTPIRYLGEARGQHMFCYPENSHLGHILGSGARILPSAYCDENWETLADVMDGNDWPSLTALAGCKFYRTKAVQIKSSADDMAFNFSFDVAGLTTVTYDTRFMGREHAVKILSATKHHVVVEEDDGETLFLDERYADPNEWVLAG